MKLFEPSPFHLVADDGDPGWISTCHLVKPCEGEEEVLERVHGERFGGGTHKGWACRRREEIETESETEVRLCFGGRREPSCLTTGDDKRSAARS